MIKNIVFDMGHVMVRYDSMRVCSRYIEDEEERKQVNTAVFISPEWLMLDMGVISEEEALEKIQARLENAHAKEMARLCLEHWHECCMEEISGMGELVRDLKARGYGIYLCSNASLRMLSCYKKVIPAIECFDGVLFSAEVKCMKPQKEMYEKFYSRFHLKAEECMFVDDLPRNIEGARETGMRGYCFEDGNVERLRRALEENILTGTQDKGRIWHE